MYQSLLSIIEELERCAAYAGPWRALRGEAPRLGRRVAELREREDRLDDLLVVALVGGSGVGKSTVLNAIAGDAIAETSPMRPCTSAPTVYHPPGARVAFAGEWHNVSRSALEHLVLIDTPDSDTIAHEHRALVGQVLGQCDLILLCGSEEKYLDEATWSLLRPLRGMRSMACIETKAQGGESVREHWLGRLQEQGFEITEYFRVSALHTFDRKLAGAPPAGDEYDWARFETFLHHELTRERIARIKKSNAAGLLAKSVTQLEESVRAHTPALEALAAQLAEADKQLAQLSLERVRGRIFTAPHLWSFALGREMSLRAKGFTGAVYRMMEALRSLPARLPALLPWSGADTSGRRAAAMLADKELFQEDLHLAASPLLEAHQELQSELALAFARAGFDVPEDAGGAAEYQAELNRRIVSVIRGPARDRIVRAAAWLTSWPVTALCDALPLALIVFAAYRIVWAFFQAPLLDSPFFLHALTVLAILLGVELFLLSLAARLCAWGIRRSSLHDLSAAIHAPGLAFRAEARLLEETRRIAGRIERIRDAIR